MSVERPAPRLAATVLLVRDADIGPRDARDVSDAPGLAKYGSV